MKPYDAIFALDGTLWVIEIKVWKEKNKTDLFKKLRPNQVQWLKKVRDNWGLALVLYYNKFHNKYFIRKYTGQTEIIINIQVEENLS